MSLLIFHAVLSLVLLGVVFYAYSDDKVIVLRDVLLSVVLVILPLINIFIAIMLVSHLFGIWLDSKPMTVKNPFYRGEKK